MQYGSGILRCTVCETTVEVLEQTGPELVCCGRVMEERIKNTDYCGGEMHAPVVEQIAGGIRVNVGAYEHPMTARHHIQWIEVVADGRLERQYLHRACRRAGSSPCKRLAWLCGDAARSMACGQKKKRTFNSLPVRVQRTVQSRA